MQGTYVVDNKRVNMTSPNFPNLLYGHYRATHTSGYKDRTYGCMKLEGQIIPM